MLRRKILLLPAALGSALLAVGLYTGLANGNRTALPAASDPPHQSADIQQSDTATTEIETQAPAASDSNQVTVGRNGDTTQVTVNGQNIPVPENGSVQHTVPTDNGQATVHISNQNGNVTTSITSTGSGGSANIFSHSTSINTSIQHNSNNATGP